MREGFKLFIHVAALSVFAVIIMAILVFGVFKLLATNRGNFVIKQNGQEIHAVSVQYGTNHVIYASADGTRGAVYGNFTVRKITAKE